MKTVKAVCTHSDLQKQLEVKIAGDKTEEEEIQHVLSFYPTDDKYRTISSIIREVEVEVTSLTTDTVLSRH